MCRPTHSIIFLLLSQQLCLWSTKFYQMLGLLRALLVKQGYFISFGDKVILNKPSYNCMFLVSVKRLHHGASNGLVYGRTHTLYRTPFDVTQIVKAFTRGMKAFLFIQHAHVK